MMNHLKIAVAGIGMMTLTACNGIFDDIYDQPQQIVPAKGQLVIDATSWTNWYYVDLNLLRQLTVEGDEEALLKAQTEFAPYPIPMTATGDKDESAAGHAAATQNRKPGQYMYWFDVFGAGIKSSDAFRNMVFTEDEWTENEVWDNQDQMLMGYVPSQGIELNRVLSSWLSMDIPPMPPAFSMNNHVFILRLKDGSYAALQLENYLSPKGTKCYLTINYKYPY